MSNELSQLITKYLTKKHEDEGEKSWGFYIVGANYKRILKEKNS